VAKEIVAKVVPALVNNVSKCATTFPFCAVHVCQKRPSSDFEVDLSLAKALP
jgi:hypothetical protein